MTVPPVVSKLSILLLPVLLVACNRSNDLQQAPVHGNVAADSQQALQPASMGDEEDSATVELPATCDVLTPADIETIFSHEFHVSDITNDRKAHAPVEYSCVINFGRENDTREERRKRRFHAVRIDVYSNRSYVDAGWGTLQENWVYRSGGQSNRFSPLDGASAGWVDSEHPPDQSLLVRNGDYLLELGYWPPSSFKGSPESDGKIEQLAKLILKKNHPAE